MTTARRLLAIDLDGTLLDGSGTPHARDVRAVRAALAAGVSVSIVTGRLYSGSRAAAEALGLQGAVGCADGSHVVRASDHATLLHRGVRGVEALALRRALARANAATFVFAKDAIGHDAAGTPYVGYMSTWSNDVRIAADVFEHDSLVCRGGHHRRGRAGSAGAARTRGARARARRAGCRLRRPLSAPAGAPRRDLGGHGPRRRRDERDRGALDCGA